MASTPSCTVNHRSKEPNLASGICFSDYIDLKLADYNKIYYFFAISSSTRKCLKGPEKELPQLAAFGELHPQSPGVQIHTELVRPEVPQSR